jgi:hypothetical protein
MSSRRSKYNVQQHTIQLLKSITLEQMRPRFSLRWLLIAVAVLAIGLYVLFIRPTVVAQRFVAAIGRGDYSDLGTMRGSKLLQRFASESDRVTSADVEIFARLEPQTRDDVFKFQRRLWVFIFFPKEDKPVERPYQKGIWVTAGIGGVRMETTEPD